eukprot:scaffold71826_cov59-Phaeocystis_antarctica.AAC.1
MTAGRESARAKKGFLALPFCALSCTSHSRCCAACASRSLCSAPRSASTCSGLGLGLGLRLGLGPGWGQG